MIELRQRHPRQHDAAHLAFVRQQKCCIKFCNRPAEAAHVRMGCEAIGKLPTGMQEKPDDKYTVPLCYYHHRTGITAQHKMGEQDFWSMVGLNPFEIAAKLWIESGGASRALEPKPVKRPKKIAARKPPQQRQKIHSRSNWPQGRTMRSRPFEKRPA